MLSLPVVSLHTVTAQCYSCLSSMLIGHAEGVLGMANMREPHVSGVSDGSSFYDDGSSCDGSSLTLASLQPELSGTVPSCHNDLCDSTLSVVSN